MLNRQAGGADRYCGGCRRPGGLAGVQTSRGGVAERLQPAAESPSITFQSRSKRLDRPQGFFSGLCYGGVLYYHHCHYSSVLQVQKEARSQENHA